MGTRKLILRNSRSNGFTIIEILIVLAIAALILLIVFLAVPQLQRNSRNYQRSHDASLVAEAVANCLTNNDNIPSNCVTYASLEIDPKTLSIFSPSAIINWDINSHVPYPVIFNDAVWVFGSMCGPPGPIASGQPQSFTVNYKYETGNGTWGAHCINE